MNDAESETGKSGRSTSIVIEADSALAPDAVVPSAVSTRGPQAIDEGMVTGICAGTDFATVLMPIGNSPMTSTSENVKPTGEVTVTVTVCPGLTVVPLAGDVIWSEGCLCGGGEATSGLLLMLAAVWASPLNANSASSDATNRSCFMVFPLSVRGRYLRPISWTRNL